MNNKSTNNVYDDYTIVRRLGEGSLGSVQLVSKKRANTGSKLYAMKSIISCRVTPEFKKELFNEIKLLRKLDHPNIVRLYEVYEQVDNYYLILQVCMYFFIIEFILEIMSKINESVVTEAIYGVGSLILRKKQPELLRVFVRLFRIYMGKRLFIGIVSILLYHGIN